MPTFNPTAANALKIGDPRLPQHFWNRVKPNDDNGCWEWIGSTAHGYGSLNYAGHRLAHRASYTALVGEIPGTYPTGLTVDHLCRNRACVNPSHMELVTRGENTLRGDTTSGNKKRSTHCDKGHEYSRSSRSDGKRVCITCKREKGRDHQRALRDLAAISASLIERVVELEALLFTHKGEDE